MYIKINSTVQLYQATANCIARERKIKGKKSENLGKKKLSVSLLCHYYCCCYACILYHTYCPMFARKRDSVSRMVKRCKHTIC